MKEKEIMWEKEGSKIKQIVPECECGTVAVLKGSSGCPHEYNYMYTYQCPNCKNIEMFDGVFSRNSEETKELEKAGWKLEEGTLLKVN